MIDLEGVIKSDASDLGAVLENLDEPRIVVNSRSSSNQRSLSWRCDQSNGGIDKPRFESRLNGPVSVTF